MNTAAKRETGTIALYHVKRGFGFVKPDFPGQHRGDLFFHISALSAELQQNVKPGIRVSYIMGTTTPKGPTAVKVQTEEKSND